MNLAVKYEASRPDGRFGPGVRLKRKWALVRYASGNRGFHTVISRFSTQAAAEKAMKKLGPQAL